MPEITSLAVHYGAQRYSTKLSPSEIIDEEAQIENNTFLYRDNSSSFRLFVALCALYVVSIVHGLSLDFLISISLVLVT